MTLFAEQIGVDQQWGMFAPPPVEDYWIVLEATNLGNFTFDLFRDRGYLDMETRTHVWWDPPPVEDFHLAFYNHRWRVALTQELSLISF